MRHGSSKRLVEDSTFRAARNGLQAVEKKNERLYDMILMDCQMPEHGRFEATRLIKEKHSDLLLVALRRLKKKVDVEKCFDSRMNFYMNKPVTIEYVSQVKLFKWFHF